MILLNIRQLKYFVAVAENLSFTKAAEKYYISQTAVTQQIKALENQLQVTLLKRSKRHVELTPAGQVFYNEACSIISHVNNAISKTQQFANGFFGTLSIGIIIGYEKNNLPEYLRNFSYAYPNVSLDIRIDGMTELLSLVKQGLMDIAFVINPEHQPLKDFTYKTIGRYSLMALLPPNHPLSHCSSIDLIELKNENFIFVKETGDEYGQKTMIQNRYREAGFVPNIVQRCNDFNTILSMVASNMGVAIQPSFILANNENKENISFIPLKGDESRIEVVAVWNKSNINPSLDKFTSIL